MKSLYKIIPAVLIAILLLVIAILCIRLSRLEERRKKESDALRERERIIDFIEHDLTMPEKEFIEKDARERGCYQDGELIFEAEERKLGT